MGEAILEIKNLKKNYQTKSKEVMAINDVSFSLNSNDFIAIVGPSGSGKTTILSILAGLLEKSDGEIIFKKNKKIGYMLQQDALFPWRTILENCLLAKEISGKLDENAKSDVEKLLNKYGLGDFKNSYPESLSGGMRQRVALIRTLAANPDILLLDEPFSALDSETRQAVSDDVYRIIKSEHKSAIMVTHDISEAISMANKVIVLSKRPATVKIIYEINFENRGLPSEVKRQKNFFEYYNLIWKDID